MAYDTAAPGDAPDRTPDRCGHAPEDGDAAGPATSNEVMCALDDVVITQELARRPSRPPDHEAENRALTALAQALASDPGSVLQQVVETAKALAAPTPPA